MNENGREWYRLMIEDRVREDAYRRALGMYVRDKTVVDVGAGLGHLSLYALEAGAKKVIAIDTDADALHEGYATTLREYQDRVVLLEGSSFDIAPKDVSEAEIMVSEVFDASGIGENALALLTDVRTRLLPAHARMIPPAIALHCALSYQPIECEAGRCLNFDLEDADLGPWFNWIPNNIVPAFVDRSAPVYGIAFAFTALLAPGVILTNLPGNPPTHWRQGYMSLGSALHLNRNERYYLRGAVTMTRHNEADVAFAIGPAV